MSSEPGDDHDRDTGLEDHMAQLAAEIDRLWEDQHDDADPPAGDGGSADDVRGADDGTPAAVIDAVVEPRSDASQSAVEEAVPTAESKDERGRGTDRTDPST